MDDDFGGIAVGAFLYAFGIYGMMQLAVGHDRSESLVIVGWVTVGIGGVIAIAYLVMTGFWRRWVFWQPVAGDNSRLERKIAELVIVVTTLGVLFGALMSMFVLYGWIEPKGEMVQDSLVQASTIFLGWHLLDAVPVLDITGSFDLKPAVTFHGWPSGALLVGFKGLLLAPSISLLLEMFRHREPAQS